MVVFLYIISIIMMIMRISSGNIVVTCGNSFAEFCNVLQICYLTAKACQSIRLKSLERKRQQVATNKINEYNSEYNNDNI